ncbi:GCN5-like N-acetyltransferase [Salinarchaeum sp. Harcht-Bsk1]|uniref:GNAT family N-acetyltransferase n=1 Tax=Salinarchaeum sp. Harcht-Bsk1 TaxID=1333523 RepID=UPI00034235EE|nr:GNAT family N-acetyltransferase [Salinarchaeum sp. Harcht-Bsk1]AGN01696.1 GCN5-like N-acetyltransferase [Salinarchaeum sp. Harcht-Bsk1]
MATARSIREDELAELLELYEMLSSRNESLDSSDPELREEFDRMRTDDSLTIVAVEHDDHLVATCTVSVTRNLTRDGRPWAVMENVVTHEDYRGEGFGTAAVEYGFDVAEQAGCYKVMLLTGRESESVLGFYEDCGFDPDEKRGFVRYLDE